VPSVVFASFVAQDAVLCNVPLPVSDFVAALRVCSVPRDVLLDAGAAVCAATQM